MRSHRLNRLALLTQGVALVGLGAADIACSKEPVPEQLHINSPPSPTDAAAPTPAFDAAGIHINAPPIRRDADAGKTSDAGK